MPIIEEYTNHLNGCTVELGKDERGLFVRCWNENDELHWEVRGVVISDTGTRQQRRAYADEAEARVEFEKWR